MAFLDVPLFMVYNIEYKWSYFEWNYVQLEIKRLEILPIIWIILADKHIPFNKEQAWIELCRPQLRASKSISSNNFDPKCFSKKISDPIFIRTQKFLDPKFFVGLKFLQTQNFFGRIIFLDPKFVGPNICLGLGNFHWRQGIKPFQIEDFRLKSCY